MRSDFWNSTRDLWRFKRLLSVALGGAMVSAMCFGAGLAMLLPILSLFFHSQGSENGHPLRELIDRELLSDSSITWRVDLAEQINRFIPDDVFGSFVLVMGIVFGLTLVGSGGRYLHQLLSITVTQRIAMLNRKRLFERLIYAPIGLFRYEEGSGYISRLIVDVNVLSRGQLAILSRAVSEILKGAAALTVALILDWKLTLLALIAAPLIAVSMRKFGKRIKRASERALKKQSAMLKNLNRVYHAIPIIKTSNAEGYERRQFARLNQQLFGEQMTMRQALALAGPVVETLAMMGVIGAATVAAWYFFNYGGDAERFLMVLGVLAIAGASLKPLTAIHTQIKESDAAATRIRRGIHLPLEPAQHSVRRNFPRLARHTRQITYQNIRFAYPEANRDALSPISFTATFGSTTAIVGANGSGKSTLMLMLPRLLTPCGGNILIDDVDIASVNLRSLREQISVVTQQTILFEGTIAQNIAYARSYTPRDQIIEAAKMACAHEFIMERSGGYDAMLDESGEGLSGGQRQRLAIARAILTDPSILILDEATSQIDTDSEAKINQALRAVRQGRTTFVIAHRLSTVLDADQIMVLDEGRLIDQGTHRELLARCSTYQILTRSQLLSPPDPGQGRG